MSVDGVDIPAVLAEDHRAGETSGAVLALGNGQRGICRTAVFGADLVEQVHTSLFATMGQSENVSELGGAAGAERALVADGRIDEEKLISAYTEVSGLPRIEDADLPALERHPEVTYDFLMHYGCLPLLWDTEQILIGVSAPYDLGRLALAWHEIFQRRAFFALVRASTISRHLTSLYDSSGEDVDPLAVDGDASEETLRDLAREAPIVVLVNEMFNRAAEMGASDIHIEPGDEELAIRYRIDGVLQTVQTPPAAQYPAIASRVKLLAAMNIAERRLPQDGRIDMTIGQYQIDIRVSTVPSMHGESIVLRLLQKESEIFDLETVGMPEAMNTEFQRLFHMPHGMILVVGPTGSGKSTSLYCVMKMLNSDERKIITVEDPVEYQLSGLTQIQVRPSIGLTFANGLRSIVRQDPDIILVGEIRDGETAEIAIHAALTGHLVLSTLHTNDAAGAVSRLLEMGVESFLISSALLCVVSQRLVRRVCAECGGEGRIPVEDDVPDTADATRRCRSCLGSGYRGRVGIFEMLLVDEDIRKAVNAHADSNEIARIARLNGMRFLREDGEDKVSKGITTAAEVARVCRLDVTT
ncbi:MAG: type II/IV secretion system protein [Lentisphaeria bacterium]|nr:type II/IV secretion system protein [Lentisphaeria bacterium]